MMSNKTRQDEKTNGGVNDPKSKRRPPGPVEVLEEVPSLSDKAVERLKAERVEND